MGAVPEGAANADDLGHTGPAVEVDLQQQSGGVEERRRSNYAPDRRRKRYHKHTQ